MAKTPLKHRNPTRTRRTALAEFERNKDKGKCYGREWHKFRVAYMAAYYLYEQSEEAGFVVKAADLHDRIKVVDAPHLRA